ncbi:MAG: CHAT domain-containing protein, partial [Nostoc sp.]
ADLIGNPGIFSFAMSQPGAIFNAGNLTVGTGQNLTLLGGTITNTGSLAAPEGQIIVSAVPGENLVRLSQPGSPLSLEIKPINSSISQANNWNLPILSLPHLLTSGGGLNANKLTVNSDGKVALSGSGISVENGDVVAGNITAETALIEANRNLTGVESQLQTTGDLNLLAGNTVQIRDTVTNPFIAKAGGNLLIQGNQGIDILALNHPDPAFQSSGNLTLMSEGVISGDAHFASGGQFSILNLAGNPGNFISLYDPIIRSNGDVTFGNYTGASLKVESAGNINAGNITINSSDANIPSSDPDATLLTTSTTLILRA